MVKISSHKIRKKCFNFFWVEIFVCWFSAKNWIIKKSSKNKNIEKNIEKNMILLFFIIIFPFCKNNLQKCFQKPFLGLASMRTPPPRLWRCRHRHHAVPKNTSWERKSHGSRKKLSKKLLFDSLLMKIWTKHGFFAKIKNDGYWKWWIWCFVKMIFVGSAGVSLKSSGRRSTAVDEIYPLAVSKSWCSCWIGVKCTLKVLLFCIDFCMVWLKSFALCWFQNSFSYVFDTFSPSNSIFVNNWIMLSFTKNFFLIKIRFDILSF